LDHNVDQSVTVCLQELLL